jgi:hypothetical protein
MGISLQFVHLKVLSSPMRVPLHTCKALLNSTSDIPSLGPAQLSRMIVGLKIFNNAKIEHCPQRAIVSLGSSVCRVSMNAIETAKFLFAGVAAGRPID